MVRGFKGRQEWDLIVHLEQYVWWYERPSEIREAFEAVSTVKRDSDVEKAEKGPAGKPGYR